MQVLTGNNTLENIYHRLDFFPLWIWNSAFRQPTLDRMLIVYADDFKLAVPAVNITEGWRLIRKGIISGEPEPFGRYLGCEHRMITATFPSVSNPCHGDIPEPFPKVQTPKPFCEDDKVRAMQVKQRPEGPKRKSDYERSQTPSTKMVKVNMIQYDMRR